MRQFNRVRVANGVLFSAALAVTAFVSASAIQLVTNQPQAFAAQPAQHSQEKPGMQQENPPQPDQSASKSVVVTGTIVKDGSDLVLKDTSGKTYRLDPPDKAEPFEGKSVKVTGKLDADANLLHVESIEATAA